MKVAVVGLWHLGSVTAAALASKGFTVVGWDTDESVVVELQKGNAPLFEPGLNDLISAGLKNKNLSFTQSSKEALKDADVIWVTFDTPVDDDDKADVDLVLKHVRELFPFVPSKSVIISSSQLPVGSLSLLEKEFNSQYKDRDVGFAVSPENLRLGKAIDVFLNPDRIIVGVSKAETKERLLPLLTKITEKLEFMSIPSAEMVKHAINAFLATSVTFINEVATICEMAGADAKEVERGLKTESRIGPKAYLGPGGPFAGGTLARDVEFLSQLSANNNFPASLINSIKRSNIDHKSWELRTLLKACSTALGKKVAILGLTYKTDTSTLRRSRALGLASELSQMGAHVTAWDPRVTELPSDFSANVTLAKSIGEAIDNAEACIICTGSPELKEIDALVFVNNMKTANIIDVNRIMQNLASHENISYFTLGSPR